MRGGCSSVCGGDLHLVRRDKLGLIVVDYLQLMQGRGGSESRVQEISEISRSLKAMAKELDVPVLVTRIPCFMRLIYIMDCSVMGKIFDFQ